MLFQISNTYSHCLSTFYGFWNYRIITDWMIEYRNMFENLEIVEITF